MATKEPPRLCGNCPMLDAQPRDDFYPPVPEYWCRLTGNWIGFRPVTPEWCLPVIQPCGTCKIELDT